MNNQATFYTRQDIMEFQSENRYIPRYATFLFPQFNRTQRSRKIYARGIQDTSLPYLTWQHIMDS